MKAIFTLTSSESKRLIAKGISQLPEVLSALNNGLIYIAGGTTNAFVVEELTDIKLTKKGYYTAGVVTKGTQCVTDPDLRIKPITLKDGKPIEMSVEKVLENFTANDVFIKGGNAIDLDGNVGIQIGESWGGTIGRSMGRLMAVGANLILPIGLEKMVPSVIEAANFAGIEQIDYSLGLKIGLIPVSYGSVYTELDVISLFADLKQIVHLSSGGVDGSEGSVTLGIEGEESEIKKVLSILQTIKGEPKITTQKRKCSVCKRCNFGRNDWL